MTPCTNTQPRRGVACPPVCTRYRARSTFAGPLPRRAPFDFIGIPLPPGWAGPALLWRGEDSVLLNSVAFQNTASGGVRHAGIQHQPIERVTFVELHDVKPVSRFL